MHGIQVILEYLLGTRYRFGPRMSRASTRYISTHTARVGGESSHLESSTPRLISSLIERAPFSSEAQVDDVFFGAMPDWRYGEHAFMRFGCTASCLTTLVLICVANLLPAHRFVCYLSVTCLFHLRSDRALRHRVRKVRPRIVPQVQDKDRQGCVAYCRD